MTLCVCMCVRESMIIEMLKHLWSYNLQFAKRHSVKIAKYLFEWLFYTVQTYTDALLLSLLYFFLYCSCYFIFPFSNIFFLVVVVVWNALIKHFLRNGLGSRNKDIFDIAFRFIHPSTNVSSSFFIGTSNGIHLVYFVVFFPHFYFLIAYRLSVCKWNKPKMCFSHASNWMEN